MGKVEKFQVNSQTKEGDCCPECNESWDGGDIYEHFLEAKFNPNHKQHNYYSEKSLEEIKESAGSYGWTEGNPMRFGEVIGVDLSMDPDAKGDDQYDGVSYWKCPKCEIAWHRFNGKRTDRFVKSPKASVIKKLAELKDEKEEKLYPEPPYPIPEKPKCCPTSKLDSDHEGTTDTNIIIYNAMQTPDGTIIESAHRHDYVTHTDKNGETYMVDGGQAYLRRNINKVKAKDLSMYLEPWTPEFHEKARKVVKRGGRGKDGTQPLKWVPVSEMNDNWVLATVEYNEERGFFIEDNWFTHLLHQEIHYRLENEIKIEED